VRQSHVRHVAFGVCICFSLKNISNFLMSYYFLYFCRPLLPRSVDVGDKINREFFFSTKNVIVKWGPGFFLVPKILEFLHARHYIFLQFLLTKVVL